MTGLSSCFLDMVGRSFSPLSAECLAQVRGLLPCPSLCPPWWPLAPPWMPCCVHLMTACSQFSTSGDFSLSSRTLREYHPTFTPALPHPTNSTQVRVQRRSTILFPQGCRAGHRDKPDTVGELRNMHTESPFPHYRPPGANAVVCLAALSWQCCSPSAPSGGFTGISGPRLLCG